MIGLSLLWIMYNTAILCVGYVRWKKSLEKSFDDPSDNDPPKISIVLPAKDEERTIERILGDLVSQDYPNYEILIVEDGSTDRTRQICEHYRRRYPKLVKSYHRDGGDGKPSAINFGAKRANGEIIAIYDADTRIPNRGVLSQIVSHFQNSEVDAIQGELLISDPKNGLIARISHFAWMLHAIYQRGKDRLGLFVSLQGNHQYVRRKVLEKLGYWDPEALTEDIEISVRLWNENHRIKYVPICAYTEAPPTLGEYFKQRVRWFRGSLQVFAKHAKRVRGGWKRVDVLTKLLSPSFSMIGLLGWLLAAVGLAFFGSEGFLADLLRKLGLLFLILTLFALALTAVKSSKNVIYIPLAYVSWTLESIASLHSHLLELLRRRRVWTKTKRNRGEAVRANSSLTIKGSRISR